MLGVAIGVDDEGLDYIATFAYLPEQSALNTALRGGDWSLEEYRTARIINELAAARADGRGYTPDLLLSPLEAWREKAQLDHKKQRHDTTLAQLRGKR